VLAFFLLSVRPLSSPLLRAGRVGSRRHRGARDRSRRDRTARATRALEPPRRDARDRRSSRRSAPRIRCAWCAKSVARHLAVTIRDEPPASFDVDRRSLRVNVRRGGRLLPSTQRDRDTAGRFQFGNLHTRQRGPLGLVERRGRVDATVDVKVYPDLREIRRYEITAPPAGSPMTRARGGRVSQRGQPFRAASRLRTYDDPRRSRGPPTARRGRPIAVEYETERQQRPLLVLLAPVA